MDTHRTTWLAAMTADFKEQYAKFSPEMISFIIKCGQDNALWLLQAIQNETALPTPPIIKKPEIKTKSNMLYDWTSDLRTDNTHTRYWATTVITSTLTIEEIKTRLLVLDATSATIVACTCGGYERHYHCAHYHKVQAACSPKRLMGLFGDAQVYVQAYIKQKPRHTALVKHLRQYQHIAWG